MKYEIIVAYWVGEKFTTTLQGSKGNWLVTVFSNRTGMETKLNKFGINSHALKEARKISEMI